LLSSRGAGCGSEEQLRPFAALIELGDDSIANGKTCAAPPAQRPHAFFKVNGDQGVRQIRNEGRMKGVVTDRPTVDLATATGL
jgi:hypothetical protein